MPIILGPFESSLRRSRASYPGGGASAPDVDASSPTPGTSEYYQQLRIQMHRTCSGAAHGHGVKKERCGVTPPRGTRHCSLPPSEDLHQRPRGEQCEDDDSEDDLEHRPGRASIDRRSSFRSNSSGVSTLDRRRSTSSKMKTTFSPDIDSGRMPDVIPATGKTGPRGHKLSVDSCLTPELGRKNANGRRSSDEVMKRMLYGVATKDDLKNRGGNLVRSHASHDEDDSGLASASDTEPNSTTNSTAADSPRQTSGNIVNRRKSFNSPSVSKKTSLGSNSSPYAFGSSTQRFPAFRHEQSSSRENLLGSHNCLHRTSSDSRMAGSGQTGGKGRNGGRPGSAPARKKSVEDAWLQFQLEVEAAMQRRPPKTGGTYKYLTDLMKDRMNQIDQARSEDELHSDELLVDGEKVWVVHREGFTAGRQVKNENGGDLLPEGKVRLRLDCNDEIIQVDEDDVEKANPPSCDRVEDLAQLRFLNESSVLHTLRQRYGNNLIYTYAGPSLIDINPCKELAIFSDKIIHMFKACKIDELPPHIYSAGQMAYRNLIATKKDQSVAFIGRSGSGKTTNFRHALSYLAVAPGSHNNILNQEKLNSVHTLLEAFGNSRTIMNSNATRFTQIFSVDYDHSGIVTSASVQVLMLEKNRVVRRPEGEPNFNIFYQLLAGLDARQRREYQIENFTEPNAFLTPLQRSEERSQAAGTFTKICKAAEVLNITPSEMSSIWSVLVAIYHLGGAGVSRSGHSGRAGFSRPGPAQRAAHCLGTNLEDLTRAVFQGTSGSGTMSRRGSRVDMSPVGGQTSSGAAPDGLEALESFAVGLYTEAFNVLVALINRSLSSSVRSAASILVVDTPGFQNPASCGRGAGATFEELCHNYTQERLQMLFHQKNITNIKEKYESEQIQIPGMEDLTEVFSPEPLIQLIDKQSVLRSSQSDLTQTDRRGLLWLLDEESIFPGSSDESFVERLMLQNCDRSSDQLIRRGPSENSFILQHFQGTNPVMYDCNGWLKASRETTVSKQAPLVLQESQDKNISNLFLTYRNPGSINMTGSIVGVEGNQTLRRASTIRRSFTSGSAGIKRYSAALQVKFQIDTLIEQLRRTRVKFVHCFLPQHTAGLCDVKSTKLGSSGQLNTSGALNIPLLRSQLRGFQILDSVRLHKLGFPDSLGYKEFLRLFSLLGEAGQSIAPGQEKEAVSNLLLSLDVDQSSFRLGVSQIFLRGGLLNKLEEAREAKLGEKIVRLQALARGHLARQKLQRLKTQDIALRCIQKNVRKFTAVREWPWWRLLVKVTPLLNVHRTEEQLKQREDEVEALRQKLEKAEKERAEFKELSEKQDARLRELSADLGEEQTAAQLATERLEAEQAERMKLEREKAELVNKNRSLTTGMEKLETELIHSRTRELQGTMLSESVEDEDNVYRGKYERCMKDLEYTRKCLAQQHEDDLEQLLAVKKQLEKKLNDAYEEVEEQRQALSQWKRKAQKVQAEMNDTRLLLEEQTARNSLLEKKQRKFDSELGMVQEDLRQESASKEKLQRELEAIKSEKSRLEDELNHANNELDSRQERITSMDREIDRLQMGGGASEDEMRALKQQKQDLEHTVKDQEEELDDLAGQVSLLEGAKTRLEMELATVRKEHRREVASKDEELEDARASAVKKVKILEEQLEQEHEERLQHIRERHEMEGRILLLQDMLDRSGDDEQISKLKKDLKRTKALLKDAQMMLDKTQNEGTNKVIIRQLKNQLEDAELARTSALKARQNAELELADTQQQLDDIMRAKQDLDEKLLRLAREKCELSCNMQETEEELQEIMRKYKASVAAGTSDQITIQDQQVNIQELETERNKLRESLAELSIRLSSLEGENVTNAQHKRLELKLREMESKLELEVTTKTRMETQISRLKEAVEKATKDCDDLRMREQSGQDLTRKLNRQLRELREDYTNLQCKETESCEKKNDLEKQLELAEAEIVTLRSDLKLALKRIDDLQAAIQGDLDTSGDSNLSSDESSDDDINTFLENHHVSMPREKGTAEQLSETSIPEVDESQA